MKASDTYTNLAWQAEINEVRFFCPFHRLDAAHSLSFGLCRVVEKFYLCQSGDVVFRYRNVAYQLEGVDAGEGRRQNIYVCGGGDGAHLFALSSNERRPRPRLCCLIALDTSRDRHELRHLHGAGGDNAVVSDNSTVRFPRRLPGDGTTRPTVAIVRPLLLQLRAALSHALGQED
jgi:hypothetical protein